MTGQSVRVSLDGTGSVSLDRTQFGRLSVNGSAWTGQSGMGQGAKRESQSAMQVTIMTVLTSFTRGKAKRESRYLTLLTSGRGFEC